MNRKRKNTQFFCDCEWRMHKIMAKNDGIEHNNKKMLKKPRNICIFDTFAWFCLFCHHLASAYDHRTCNFRLKYEKMRISYFDSVAKTHFALFSSSFSFSIRRHYLYGFCVFVLLHDKNIRAKRTPLTKNWMNNTIKRIEREHYEEMNED